MFRTVILISLITFVLLHGSTDLLKNKYTLFIYSSGIGVNIMLQIWKKMDWMIHLFLVLSFVHFAVTDIKSITHQSILSMQHVPIIFSRAISLYYHYGPYYSFQKYGLFYALMNIVFGKPILSLGLIDLLCYYCYPSKFYFRILLYLIGWHSLFENMQDVSLFCQHPYHILGIVLLSWIILFKLYRNYYFYSILLGIVEGHIMIHTHDHLLI